MDRPETVIVVARELASFYEFLKPRQEAEYGTLVVLLDRRDGERRQERGDVDADRRRSDRRSRVADVACPQLSVLGFAILHRAGERYLP